MNSCNSSKRSIHAFDVAEASENVFGWDVDNVNISTKFKDALCTISPLQSSKLRWPGPPGSGHEAKNAKTFMLPMRCEPDAEATFQSQIFSSSPRYYWRMRKKRVSEEFVVSGNDVGRCLTIEPDLSKYSVRIQDSLEKELGLDHLLPRSPFFTTFNSTQPLNREDWAARLSIRNRRST